MASFYFDFTTMVTANPASPPMYLRSWSKFGTNLSITNGSGAYRTTNGASWMIRDFVPNKRYIRLKGTFGGSVPSGIQRCGFILSENDSKNPAAGKMVMYTGVNITTSDLSNATISNTIPIVTNVIMPATLELYIDRMTGLGYAFKGNKGVGDVISGLENLTEYGVYIHNTSSTFARDFLVEDTDTMPLWVGGVRSSLNAVSSSVVYAATIGQNLAGNNIVKFKGFTPRFCKFNGVSVPVKNIRTDQLEFTLDLDRWVGKTFTYTYTGVANSQKVPYCELELSDGSQLIKTDCRVMAHRGNLVRNSTTPASLSSPNFNYWYTVHGGTGMPVDSLMVPADNYDSDTNLASIASNGVITLSNVSASDGNLYRHWWIIDSVDNIVRKFKVTFSISSNVATVTNVEEVPAHYNINVNDIVLSTVDQNDVDLDTWVESSVLNDDFSGGDYIEFTDNPDVSYFIAGEWTAWQPYTTNNHVMGLFKIRVKSSNRSLVEKVITATYNSVTVLTWYVVTKYDAAALSTQSYDFSTLPVSDTPVIPEGLELWSSSTGTAKIVEEGITSTSTTGLTVWSLKNYAITSRVIKLSFVLGSNGSHPAASIYSAGIFIGNSSAMDSPDNSAGVVIGAHSAGIKLSTVSSGNILGVPTLRSFLVNPPVAGKEYAVYIDTVRHKAIVMTEGGVVLDFITLPSTYDVFGIGVKSTTIVRSFTFENYGDVLPSSIGLHSQYYPIGNIYINESNIFTFDGFKPKFCLLGNIPLKITDGANDNEIVVEDFTSDKFLGVAIETYSSIGLLLRFTFSDFIRTMFRDNGFTSKFSTAVIRTTISGGAYVGDSANLNTYYKPNGNNTTAIGIPAFSVIFSKEIAVVNSTFINPNGVITISNLDNNVGTIYRDIYVIDGDTKKLYKMICLFTKTNGSLTAAFMSEFTGNDITRFVSNLSEPLRTVVESNVAYIPGGDSSSTGALYHIRGNAEVSYDTGSGWSEWARPDVNNPMEMNTSLDPLPVKLRAVSSNLSGTVREFALVEDQGVGIEYKWYLGTGLDETPFIPNLTKDAEEVLVDLINHENGSTITEADVDVINPIALDDLIPANTTATLTAATGSRFSGSLPITYSRIDIGVWANGDGDADIAIELGSTWTDVIDAFNAKYNTNLTTDDYEDEPTFGVFDGSQTEWTITAKSTSLVYTGDVLVEIHFADIPLNRVNLISYQDVSSGVVDIYAAPKNAVVELINDFNSLIAFTSSNITIGNPTPKLSTYLGNTDVVVTGVNGLGYKDSILINYNRVAMSYFGTLETPLLTIDSSTPTNQQVLDAFNSLYGTSFALSDFTWETLPTTDSDGETYSLVASSTNLLATGSLTVTIKTLRVVGNITTLQTGPVVRRTDGVVINNKLYVPGGSSNVAGNLNVVNIYTFSTNTWSTGPNGILTGDDPAVDAVGTKMYVFGGSANDTNMHIYDTTNDTWSTQATSFSESRIGAKHAVVGNYIYYLGGYVGVVTYSDFWRYDTVNNTWLELESFPTGSVFGELEVVNGILYAIAGVEDFANLNSTRSDKVYAYNITNDTWEQLTSMSATLNRFASNPINGFIYVHGGSEGSSTRVNTLREYDPVTNTWRTIGGIGSERFAHLMVTYGSAIYLFGGDVSSVTTGDLIKLT